MYKDRKFSYLLNVEECLDVMLYERNTDIQKLVRYFDGYELVMERMPADKGIKLVVMCQETDKVFPDGHTEFYDRRNDE